MKNKYVGEKINLCDYQYTDFYGRLRECYKIPTHIGYGII